MNLSDRVERTNEAAEVIARALAEHYGGTIDVYAVLGGLSTIAVDIIKKSPPEDQAELLDVWDEAPAYVRAQVRGHQ